jgi:hypothetical protein
MSEQKDPRYRLTSNDPIEQSAWTQANIEALISGLNSYQGSSTISETLITGVSSVNVPVVDGEATVDGGVVSA